MNPSRDNYSMPATRSFGDDLKEFEFEPLSLGQIIEIYKRWYKLSIIAFIAIIIPAVIVIFLILPLHKAKGTVWINRITPESDFAVQKGAMPGSTTFRNLDRQEEIATFAEMVKARPIAVATIDKLDITIEKLNHIHDYRKHVRAVINWVIESAQTAFNEVKYFLRLSKPMSPELKAQLNRVRLIDNFIDRIDVTPVQESNILEISFKSSDPFLAQEVVDIILDEFISFSNSIKEERARKYFSSSAAELREELQAAEQELLELQNQYAGYSVDQQRHTLVTNYSSAKDRLRSLNVQLAKVSAMVEGYKQSLKESSPNLRQQIKLNLVNWEVQKSALEKEIAASEVSLERYVAELEELGSASLLIKDQLRKTALLEEVYEINLRNFEGASAIQAMNLASLSALRVVSYAAYPLKPIRPRKLMYLLIAFGGALLVSLGFPFLAFLNDKTIATEEDVKKSLGFDYVVSFPTLNIDVSCKS